MEKRFKVFLFLFLFVFLSGCAHVISKELRVKIDLSLTFHSVSIE